MIIKEEKMRKRDKYVKNKKIVLRLNQKASPVGKSGNERTGMDEI